jgi:hypothetical protein
LSRPTIRLKSYFLLQNSFQSMPEIRISRIVFTSKYFI